MSVFLLWRRTLVAVAVLLATSGLFVLTCSGSSIAVAASKTVASQPPPCPVPGSSTPPLYMDTRLSFAQRAADLVSCMTPAEKATQLRTGTEGQTDGAPAIPSLGVKEYTYWTEGQHGIQEGHGTSFPVNMAATMSWDPKLVYRETTAISDEFRGFASTLPGYGPLSVFAPTVNLDRDPRWGRTDEAFGEDPFLAGTMANAFVDGYQGETMSGKLMTPYLKVAATAKHFALNNVEDNRQSGSSDTSDADLRNYYLAQFKMLTQDAHVAGVMTSYNAINGTPSPADTYTANELLQRTFGFNGYTTSDCGAVSDVYSKSEHGWAPPGWTTDGTTWTDTATGQTVPAAAGGQGYALRAGTDLNCTGAEATSANIDAAINSGVLSQGVVDNALVHLFTMRMETGEFDPSHRVAYQKIGAGAIQTPAHQALATKVAAEDLVLLKNDDVAGTRSPLLPVDPSRLNNVVIVGNLANTVTLGDYSGSPSLRVNAVQGITAAVKAANPNATVTFDACGTSTKATAPASCSAATQAAIKAADLVIVFVGTDTAISTEGLDRTTIAMPGNYNSLIGQVNAIGNPNTALVIQSNGPVDISDTQGDFPAIVYSAYNGESQGTALAQVLFGQQDPAGHLDFTWYEDDSQLPDIMNYGLTPSETGGLGRTYQYFTGTPTYPFGYGLSYATFRYSHVRITPRAPTPNGRVDVRFEVTNTGRVSGTTVAQVYAASEFSASGVEMPNKRLVGFQKTHVLRPGQTERITIPVALSRLELWDSGRQKMVVYDGRWRFQLATDSSDVVSSGTVRVHGFLRPKVQVVTVQPDQTVFAPGQKLDLTGQNPWIADDTGQASQHVPATNIVEAANNDESFANLAHARVRYRSSDPNVATVNRAGLVTMNAHGTATISVTVDGVTGSTPIVVQQPLNLTTLAGVVQPGSTFTATTALPNSGARPLTDVSMSLDAPSGWTATAETPATFASVAPGRTATTTWQVTVAANPQPGFDELDATATFTDANGQTTVSTSGQVSVPFATLADAFDNVGISDATHPGNIDGQGDSYSQDSLDASGFSPGATVTGPNISYTWPNVPAGQPDNVQPAGQTIDLTGSGATLSFLGMAANGEHSATGTINYTDGSSQTFTLTFPDWFTNGVGGTPDEIVGSATVSGPFAGHHVSVYAAPVPLEAGKTIEDVTLPSQIDMHIFAIAIGQPFTSLAGAFNNVGISDDSNPSGGDIDGLGDSWSAQSLAAAGIAPGGTVTEQGVTYTWPNVPAAQADNVAAGDQTVPVTGSGSSLGFLGMATNGTHTATGTILYSDGTMQTYTLTYPDWFANSAAGTSDQLVASGTLNGARFQGHVVGLYAAEVPIDPSKTVSAVVLPGDGDMHIFAISTG